MNIPRRIQISWVIVSVLPLLGGVGCSSTPSESASSETESTEAALFAPPAVVSLRADPEVVHLTQDLDTNRPVNIFADVKSLGAEVDKVRLRLFFSPDTEQRLKFFNRPVEIEMKHLAGTTWQGQLAKNELSKLAINGQIVQYEGRVVAENDKGQVTLSEEPVRITIEAPLVVKEG